VVGEFELAPGADEYRTVVLPAARVLASSTLGFELMSGPEGAGADPARAVDFRAALFRPSVLGSRG
jgi:hypothetical protein